MFALILYTQLNILSSNNEHLFNKKYTEYIDAVAEVLENRDLQQKWLVENIIRDEKKSSLTQQVSRWIRESRPVSEGYRHRINKALNINVDQDAEGFWVLRSQDSHSVSEPTTAYADRVDLPEDGQLSRGQMKELLSQIESIVRILKDSL